MRKSRNGQRRAFAAFTKFSVLLMCFATVFALVLTAGVFDIGGSDMNANVAEANTSGGSVNAMTFSTAADGSELVTQVQNDMHSSKTGDFTYTINLGDQGVSAQSYTSIHGWGDGAKPVQYYSSGKNSSFGGQETEKHGGANYTSLQVALNIQTPQIFLNWASRYKIDITFSGTLYTCNEGQGWLGGGNNCGFGMGIVGSGSAMNANTFASYFWCDGSDHKDGEGKFYLDNWREPAGWITNDSTYWNGVLFDTNGNTVSLSNTMTNLTAVLFRESGGSENTGIYAENVYFTFTIHKDSVTPSNNASDNNAPRAELASAVDESYITADNIGNYAQGELIGSIGQIAGAPVLSNNHVDLTAGATRKGSIGVDGVDNKYAKKVQLNINEINADGGNASATQATYYAGLAGITVGSITSQTSTTHGAFTYSATEGTGDGYYHWAVSDAGRAQGVLTLYFNDNVSNLKVRVYDSGGSSLEITVNVGGIKTGGDDLTGSASITDGTRMKDESSASFDGLTWEWNDLVPTFKNMGGGADAQIWFYAVQKYNNATDAAGAGALFSATEGNSGITPIGFTDADGRWTAAGGLTTAGNSGFDFTKGLLYGVAPVNGGSATGSGYYRFEFYPMNYAGYIGTPVVRLVKADVGIAEPDVKLSYDPSSKSGNPLVAGTLNDGVITNYQGAYISTDLTVTITFAANISGNKVSVMGADGENYIFLIGSDGGIKGVYTVSNNALQPSSGKWGADYSMTTGGVFEKVVVSASVAGGTMTVKAVYTAPADKITEKTHTFTIYTNADDDDTSGQEMVNCLSDYDFDWEEWTTEDGGKGNGTRLWFDTVGITDVTLGSTGGQIHEVLFEKVTSEDKEEGKIPEGAERKWYTDGWELAADLSVIANDDEWSSVFYLQQYYTGTITDKATYTGAYDGWTFVSTADGAVTGANDWTLLEEGASITFDANTEGAGYYVIYVIAVDRASNISPLGFYGVLIDANEYTITAVYDEATLAQFGDIDPFNFESRGEQTLKRGALYKFPHGLKAEFITDAGAHAYVPYQISKVRDGENVPIYTADDNDVDGKFKAKYFKEYLYAAVAEDGWSIDLDVDRSRVTALPAIDGKTRIVFSYRQVVNATFDNTFTYNGARLPVTVSTTNVFGNQVTVTTGNEPYSIVYPEGYFKNDVTHAGSYDVSLKRAGVTSKFFVLNEEVTRMVSVAKAPLTIEASIAPGDIFFGDMTLANAESLLNFTYNIAADGLQGADAGETDFTKLHNASIKVIVDEVSEGSYARIGDHAVNVTFTAGDYTVTVSWTSAQSVNIKARAVEFTVDDPANVTYGDAMPTEYTLRVPKSVFGFDSKGEGLPGLGLYQDAAGVESLIGKTVREDGDYWVFSVPQSDFAAFIANDASRYNVGTYTVEGFKGTFFNNNIALSMAEGGEGTFEVTTRTITISPAIPSEPYNVEDESEAAGFTFNIAGTSETSAYGLRGQFTAGDPTDVKNQYYIVGDPADFTSADNEYKEGNVTIVLATDQSGWVFSINIIAAAGKIVIEFTSADIFNVTYGTRFDAAAIAENADGKYYKILYYAKDANAEGGYAASATDLPEGVTSVEVTIKVDDRYEPEEQNVFNNHYGDYTLTVTAEAATEAEDLFFTYEYRTAEGDMPSYVHVGTLNTTVTVSEVTALSKEYGADDPTADQIAKAIDFDFDEAVLGDFIATVGKLSVSGFTAGWDRLSDVDTYGYNWSGCTFKVGDKVIDSRDISFKLEGTESVTFEITQKELNIDKLIADGGILIGGAADKKYDGGSEASATLAFSTAGSAGIIVSGDNVSLAYEANYWKDGENVFDIGSGYSIRFSAITLTGNETDIGNYLLTGSIHEETGFVYVYFGEGGFRIDPNPVNIEIGWFGVTKVYDGTTDIAPQDGVGEVKVTFPQGGTLDSTGWSFVSGKFDSANAGTGVFADITLIFPNIAYPELSGEFELSDYFTYSEDFFALSPVDPEDGSKGMKISITGLSGSITQRTITESYITIGFSAKTKVYDGDGDFGITVGFTDAFKEIFKGSIDLDRQVGLVIAAATDKNVGTHMMEVTGITIADTNNFTLCTHLKGEDGFAAVEEKINGNAATFIINKKSVELAIDFADGVYDANKKGPDTETEPYIRGIIDAEREMVDITSTTFTYSNAEGNEFNYVQKEYFENGHYLHDVVATLVFTVSGEGFSWGNYDFGEIILTENEGTATVSGLLLQKAAVLDPKQVTLNLSEISVKDGGKVYDATTDIELIFPEKVYEKQFFESDLAKLDFTYTAALDSANVGTRNVNISDIKPVLKEANAAETHILDSYSIKFSGSFTKTAVVDPVEVTVEFTIPDKTYDGTRFVNMSAAEGSLVAPKDSGRDTWYVAAEQFVNNYYVSVVAAYYDDVNVVRDSGTGNPGYKKGTVIGFELVCTQGTSNYVLVGVEGEEKGVLYNLYSFPAGTDISSAYEYIEGVVTEGGNTYYLVRENNTAAQEVIGTLNGELYATRSYNTATATGRILPAQIDFEVEIINPDAFTKAFDDTTALVTEPTLGTDYRIIVEQIGVGDITGITVSFSGAAVGRQDVIFAVSQTAESNPNYSFNAGDSYTVRGGGYINKFGGTINAAIDGGITATYGTADLSYTVRYYYISNTEVVDIIVDAEGNAYVTLDGWKAMFGHDDDDLTADVTARRYTNENGEWLQSNNGKHIRITGKFGTPTLLTEKGGSEFVDKDGLVCVDAGTYSNVHLDVKADSFNVGIASGSETVTINAKDLRVYVTNAGEGGNFTADYFVGKLPVPGFGLFMKGEVNDLAAFDTWAAVQKTLRGQFMNGETPLTSTDVPIGNYALKVTTTTGNYNIIIVTEAGETAEHKLVITIPELDKTQYKVKTNLKRQYELGADGQGVALDKSDLLNATAVADRNNNISIIWKDANGNEIPAPTDVGTYNWELTVTKKIGGSQTTYTYAGEFTANGSFTIEKRRITVSLKESVGFTYDDGKEHVITKDDLTAKDADGNADEFIALISNNITYLLNGTSCTDMTNAGGYTVVLEFVDSPNYELVNNVGTVYVKAKPITVKVDPASKVYDATNGINGNVGISFTAEGADASDFSVVYRSAGNVVGAITTPGIYTYTIVSKDPNYTVSGESTGNFNVQISKVTYTKDDIDYVTITFGSPVAVNYYLNDTAVAQGSGYWNIVDANVQKLAGEDGGLVTNGIIRIEMSNNNGVVSTVPGGVTVTARIPAGVGSDFTLYRVTSSGGLEVVEDYTVANGVVTYTTDYISNLVFVGTAPVAGFPWWIIPIIAAALVLTLALAILIAVLVKLHRAPDPIPVEVTPIDSIMPEPPVPAPAAPVAPVIVEVPAADIAPTVYDAPAAVSKHKQPPIIGIR